MSDVSSDFSSDSDSEGLDNTAQTKPELPDIQSPKSPPRKMSRNKMEAPTFQIGSPTFQIYTAFEDTSQPLPRKKMESRRPLKVDAVREVTASMPEISPGVLKRWGPGNVEPGVSLTEMAILASEGDDVVRRQSWSHPDPHQVFGGHESLATPPARRTSLPALHNPPKLNKEMSSKWVQSQQNSGEKTRFMSMLRKLKIFKISSNAFLEAIVPLFEPVEYEPNAPITKQGDRCDWMAICLMGSANVMVRMDTDEEKVSELRPGMTFGELAALGINQNREASVIATRQGTTLLVLSYQSVKDACDKVPSEKKNFEGLMDNYLEFDSQKLTQSTAFAQRDPQLVRRLQNFLIVTFFLPGEVMMREGMLGDTMYILHRGVVSVEKEGRVLVQLKDNAVLGEMAVVGTSGEDQRRSATVLCKTWCITQVLSGKVFCHLLEQFPAEKADMQDQSFKRRLSNDLLNIRTEVGNWNLIQGRAHPEPKSKNDIVVVAPKTVKKWDAPRRRHSSIP